MEIRPMRVADIPAAERVSARSFLALDEATHRADDPAPALRGDARAALWRRRAAHLVEHDSPGCWVAADGDQVIGLVMSLRREGLWGLSAFNVDKPSQGLGLGRRLLDAALVHGEGSEIGIICSSHDPRAVRRYARAGFTVHPSMLATGVVTERSAVGDPDVRLGTEADLAAADEVDRAVRGATRGPDHSFLYAEFDLLVTDGGYCYADESGRARVLAATTTDAAERLLRAALGRAPEGSPVEFGDITAEQQWAVHVALDAGLDLRHEGYLCLRGAPPPAPYLPSAHFL